MQILSFQIENTQAFTVFSLIKAPGPKTRVRGASIFRKNVQINGRPLTNLNIIQDEKQGGGASIGEGLLLERIRYYSSMSLPLVMMSH